LLEHRYDDRAISDLARRLGERLAAVDALAATAESCTGGWIAKALTDIAGSSAWFERGLVTYSNTAKQDLLGVSADLLVRHGAVSEAVVRQMAEGVLARCPATLVVAVSGVAGPGGGSADKPVGTVWFAWAGIGGPTGSARQRFAGEREAVRRQTVVYALQGMLARLG
jgi:nicotinamide-nucleotide amidase